MGKHFVRLALKGLAHSSFKLKHSTQPALTCSKSIMETQKRLAKSIKS